MKGMMHILGHPLLPLDISRHAEDSQLFNCWNFCQLMERLGLHYCYYGCPGSALPAGGYGTLAEISGCGQGPWVYRNLFHKRYNAALESALREKTAETRGEPQWVASMYGVAQSDIAPEGLPVIFEPMAGYGQCWTSCRVFPSNAQRDVIYARQPLRRGVCYCDAVIPHFVNPAEYDFSGVPGEYLLFLGRSAFDKGYALARETAAAANVPYREVFTGCRGAAKRKLLAGALAVMMPTLYPEPFGYVAAEAMLSGTPVLATAWGAFPEIIRSGVSGWCCASPGEFVRAARKARSIRRQGVRDWALRHFTVDAVAASYRRYLRALSVPPDSAAGHMAWLRL